MEIITLQSLLALAMFLITAVAGLVPVKLLHILTKKGEDLENRRVAWTLTLLSCFAGGVFMGTCFLDIFPHVNENYARFKQEAGWKTEFPFPEFFVCCGFFLVYLLEEACLKVFAGRNSTHSHSHSHEKPSIEEKTNGGVDELLKASLHSASNGRGSRNSTIKGDVVHSENPEGTEKYVPILTHDMVMDESVRYISTVDSTASKGGSGLLRSLTFAIAMSFHSILEGFAQGVQDDITGITTLFVSLIIHKGIEAFGVGLQMSKSNSKRAWMVTMTMVVYALMTPLGTMLGVGITNLNINELTKDGIIVVLEGLAGGTFIYVTFFEVLAQERANAHSNLVQWNAIVLGFLVIAGLQANEHFFFSSHSHSHGH